MISYEKFWQTLKYKNISQYKLSVYYGISNSQLCKILDCRVEDIITFTPDNVSANLKIPLKVGNEQGESVYKND